MRNAEYDVRSIEILFPSHHIKDTQLPGVATRTGQLCGIIMTAARGMYTSAPEQYVIFMD